MPVPDPTADLELLTRAAHEAGEIALRHFRNQPRIWDKPGGAGPVTEADLEVDAALAVRLRAARPDYGWLSEETEDDPARQSTRACFILDPIDGTRAFIEGQDAFATALAVAVEGRVTAAVVFLPARATLYTATLDGPACRDGAPIATRAPADPPALLTSRPALEPAHWRGGTVPPIARHIRPSIAWRLALLAEGRFDGVLSFRPAWEWDIAAGSLIAARAGAQVTDRHGAPLRFNRPRPQSDGLWAAPPALHHRIAAQFA